jgi:hypothetical protein
LKYLIDQRLSTILQHAWVSKLFGYQFMVEFKLGRQNVAADALSYRDEELTMVHAISLPEFKFFHQFRQESSTLPEIAAKRAEIEAGSADKAWRVADGIVVCISRIFLPASSKLWPAIMEQAHNMGHEGIQKTLQRLRASFFTPHDNKLVREYIRDCSVCQQYKIEDLHPVGSSNRCQSRLRYGLILPWIS